MVSSKKIRVKKINGNKSFWQRIKSDMQYNYALYLLVLPVVVYFVIFKYKPMYGTLIAFQDYVPSLGFLNSPWVGFKHFKSFLQSPDLFRLVRNTLRINLAALFFGFPLQVMFALLLNELRQIWVKNTVQNITYLPHFVSDVVICGIIRTFVGRTGIISGMVSVLTGGAISGDLLQRPGCFVPILILSGTWQTIGWNSIIYVAALAGIDQQLYEAAKIDGAGKWRQTLAVTLPGIWPTIAIMLIMQIGSIMSSGGEKILLLYNPLTYETADVIGTYVYRRGLQGQQWSYTTAVGLMNTVINIMFVTLANYASKRATEVSLW